MGIIRNDIVGENIINGSSFFGNSSLTPLGTFSNIPNYYVYTPSPEQEADIIYNLKKIKDSIKKQLESEYKDSNFDDSTVEKFLYEFTSLLIDYRDMRNYIFFGSAHTELAYNIKKLIQTFPYKTLISDITETFTKIQTSYNISENQTTILFDDTAIKDYGNFELFDDKNSLSWLDYDVVDKNDKRYSILKVIAPYTGTGIFNILSVTNGVNSILIQTDAPHNYVDGQLITLDEISGTPIVSGDNITINQTIYKIHNLTADTFEIFEPITNNTFTLNFVYTTGGIVRKSPLDTNEAPFSYKVIIEGSFNIEEFISYSDNLDVNYTGFMISPKLKIINDFQFNLTPVQKILLAPVPINQTPWPLRAITGNIQNKIDENDPDNNDPEFVNWLQDPNFLFIKNDSEFDNDVAFGSVFLEYRLTKALALDETYSNQLIRRCIPHEILENFDTPNGYFQRFILIAGWFFDQIYLYVKFLKYVHHLNYTDYNQLSPEYYKFYADYYGFDLFSDDSVDFSKLVIQTEPGLVYSATSNVDVNNKYYRSTIQQLQYERQKRLLLSLFYLYRTKGTPGTIKKLVSLLGAPEGLLVFNEYSYQIDTLNDFDSFVGSTSGKSVINNEKIQVPKYHFEIDTDYLKNKTNIKDPVNLPYVYKMRLENESDINLREASIQTAPNRAIDYQILNFFGKQKYSYLKFENGEFANLQNETGQHYLLPLSLPDKFFGTTTVYMIPRGGFVKGISNNLEEVNIHLASLYMVDAIRHKDLTYITGVTFLNVENTLIRINIEGIHDYMVGDKIEISSVSGIVNLNNSFTIVNVSDTYSFDVEGTFSGTYINGGIVSPKDSMVINNGFNYTYPLPELTSNYDDDSFLLGTQNPETDFDLLYRKYPSSSFSMYRPYVISRVEGKDLVVRLRLDSELNSQYVERIAVLPNVFSDDGLNHTLRLIYRAEGVEVYQDYKFLGIAKWKNPAINNLGITFSALEIPKKNIENCDEEEIDILNFAANGTNSINQTIGRANLTVLTTGNVGDLISLTLPDPYFGNISLGVYSLILEDTLDINTLTKNLATLISSNTYNYTVSYVDNVITIFAPASYVDSINGVFLAVTSNLSLNSTQFYGASVISDDKIRWWDVFIGMPTNLEMYFNKVEVFENAGIDSFNISDNIINTNNYDSDTYKFDLKYTIEDVDYTTFSDCQFFKGNPNLSLSDYSYLLPSTLNNQEVLIVKNLKLSSKSLLDVSRKFKANIVQNFFENPDVFKNFGWQKNLHKDYEYENFSGKVLDVYNLYSTQKLTYQSLLAFLDLIENKFKKTILQFIPIVINISKFGRLIENSIYKQKKFRYVNAYKNCIGVMAESDSSVYTQVFATDQSNPTDGILVESTINLQVNHPTLGGISSLFTVPWNLNPQNTLRDLVEQINSTSFNVLFPHIRASFVGFVLRLEVDYDWFELNNPGNNANELILTLFDGTNTFEVNFANGNPPPADNDCFSIKITIPNPTKQKQTYLYFDSENKPRTIEYFDSENKNPFFLE